MPPLPRPGGALELPPPPAHTRGFFDHEPPRFQRLHIDQLRDLIHEQYDISGNDFEEALRWAPVVSMPGGMFRHEDDEDKMQPQRPDDDDED